MKKAAFLLFIFFIGGMLWAQNRHALIIGNANYPRIEDRLPNAINDTNAIRTVLQELGFQVVLKQDIKHLDMVREIEAFITRLRNNRNSEGFFWYAGHAEEIGGENFLMPLDVNLETDELKKATTYSINNLTRQLADIRNKVNVVVLDACRIPPSKDGRGRSTGDTSRVIKPVQLPSSSDIFLIYSTAPGTVALDAVQGSQNSPFAKAFLDNVKRNETLTQVMGHVTSDTLGLTTQRQRPFMNQSAGRENINYSLNPEHLPPPPPPPISLYDQLVNATGTTTIIVTQDTQLPSVTLSKASSITLRGDTAGRTVSNFDGGELNVERGVTLTVENITLKGISIIVMNGGTLIMNNLTSIIGACVSARGSFIINGGCIANNDGPGVYVDGTLSMKNGRIENNSGGGVIIFEGGQFIMSGGTITGNRGSGVYVNGHFSMTGGTISNNRATGTGGGVSVHGYFSMTGGTIAGNRATNGGGVYVNTYIGYTFRKTGGIIYGSNEGINSNTSEKGNAVYVKDGFFDIKYDRTIGSSRNINALPTKW